MGKLDGDLRSNPVRVNHPIQKREPVRQTVKPSGGNDDSNNTATLKSNLQIYGQQQKERLERLYAAGAGGALALKDVGLMRTTSRADKAYDAVYSKGLKSGKDWIEVSKNAEAAYRKVLGDAGFKAADVKGTSFAKAVDLINSEAERGGNFKTLAADGILNRLGDEPKYLVRIVDQPKYLRADDSKIAGKKNVWFATAEEIAGAKKNIFEVMQRVGYTPKDIKDARDAVKSGKKSVSDYYLVVAEAEGTKNNGIPKWDRTIAEVRTMNAAGETDFQRFSESKDFWRKVENLDFEKTVRKANQKGLLVKNYAETKLPKSQREVALARNQIKDTFGASEMYTGEGYTRRADGQNGKMGVNELWIENFELRSQKRNAFIQLNADAKSTKVETVSKLTTIAENPLRLRGEMKTGALAGGAISAVTSLPQVFGQARDGDYSGAAKTLATNTAFGGGVGAFSSGGERIVGSQIENALGRSAFAQQGIDRLFSNGAARSVVGRLAQTEASNLTSQTFGATTRAIAGRVGGAGVIGGVVNGAFSAYDQIGAYRRGEVSGSQAIGTVTGEAAVGVGAGLAGAAAGAAIGSIIPVAGTIVGGVIGFGVGVAAGYLADKGLRGLHVDKFIAKGVTATIDAGSRFVGAAGRRGSQAIQAGRQFVGEQIAQAKTVYRAASSAVKTARAFVGQKLADAGQRVSSATRAAVNYVSQAKDRAVRAFRDTASQAVNQVRSTVDNAVNTVSNIASQARSTVSNAVENVASGAVNSLKSVFSW